MAIGDTTVSVVVPVKDEAKNLRPLEERLRQTLTHSRKAYEIVFVDDGSTDDSFSVVRELAAVDPAVKVVRLCRNFGQAAALQAGIQHCSGHIILTLDGDGQSDPADIPQLLTKLEEGYDAVFGGRVSRRDAWLTKRLPSRLANWLVRLVTGVSVTDIGCPVRAMRRELAVLLQLRGGLHRFVPVLAVQLGARIAQVPVRHHPRVAGKSKYGLGRIWPVLRDLFRIRFGRWHSEDRTERPYQVRATINLQSSTDFTDSTDWKAQEASVISV